MSRLGTHIDRLSDSHIAARSLRWFRGGIYLFVLYNTLVLSLPMVDELWGTESLVLPLRFTGLWTNKIFMALHYPERDLWHWPLLILQFIGLALFFRPRWTTVSAILVYVTTVLLYNRLFLFTIGGNLLLHLMLFYLLFMAEHVRPSSWMGRERILLSNIFFWAARFQLLMVYLVSGAYKLSGTTWLNGDAVAYVLNIDEFTTPWIKHGLADVGWLTAFFTYIALTYLLAFPLLVWIRPIKPYLLAFGVLFHIGLGWAVGVMDFSLVMIICYLLFVGDKRLIALTDRLAFPKPSIADLS